MAYHVSSREPAEALFNEAFYRGWQAEVCPTNGPRSVVRAASSAQGMLSAALPAGEYTLTLRYRTPGMGAAWTAFTTGVLLLALWAGGTLTRQRRRGPSRDRGQGDARG